MPPRVCVVRRDDVPFMAASIKAIQRILRDFEYSNMSIDLISRLYQRIKRHIHKFMEFVELKPIVFRKQHVTELNKILFHILLFERMLRLGNEDIQFQKTRCIESIEHFIEIMKERKQYLKSIVRIH